MEKEFHVYLGENYSSEKRIGIILYLLADFNSDYNLELASSIMENEGFENGRFLKVGKKDYIEMNNDETLKEYFETAIQYGYCIVKYN